MSHLKLPAFLIISFLLLTGPLYSQQVEKEEVLSRYEKVVSLVEQYNVYQEDIFDIIPKVRLAGNYLLQDKFEHADRVLNDAMKELDLIRVKRAESIEEKIKVEWLEIFFDIFQKYAILAFLAYLFVKWPFFNRMIRSNRFTALGRLYLALLASSAAIFLSFFDLMRYGESAWAFVDTQLILVVLGGLFGGFWAGLLSGLCVGFYRLAISSSFIVYFAIILTAGIVSGIASRKIKDHQSFFGVAFCTSCFLGLFHGISVYLPAMDTMPWYYFLFTLGLIAFLDTGGVLIFLGVVSNTLREQQARQTENDLLKAKLLFLQAQMNPHFLFNALNAISSVCGRENAKEAQTLILRLADFLRGTLKREKEYISLKEEMEYIDAYLEIEKARFQDRLNVVKDINIQEKDWKTLMPLLVLQPLVENAVRHGIGNVEEGGTVTIKVEVNHNAIIISVSDDGAGMKMDVLDQELIERRSSRNGGMGIGVRNIHQRLVQYYGKEYGLKYEGNNGKGTKVTVRIPLKREDKL